MSYARAVPFALVDTHHTTLPRTARGANGVTA